MNNYLEGYYFRKEKIGKILSGIHYENDHIRQSTVIAWTNSNLSLEQIEYLINNADKKEIEDIENKHDLKLAMEKEQLRIGFQSVSSKNLETIGDHGVITR